MTGHGAPTAERQGDLTAGRPSGEFRFLLIDIPHHAKTN
jgi:hypothetical protein